MKLSIIVAIGFFLSTVPYGSPMANKNCSSVWDENLEQLKNRSATVRFTLLHSQHPCLLSSTRPVNHPSISILSRDHAHVHRLSSVLSSYLVDEANVYDEFEFGGVTPPEIYTYMAKIHVGTPPKAHYTLIDTRSSLSWIDCQPCRTGCSGTIFNPATSSTYRIVGCLSSICNLVPAATMSRSTCFSSYQKCSFKQTYHDNSASIGVVSSDRLNYRTIDLPDFKFGCSNSFNGVRGKYSGIIGLSTNILSFFTQVTVGRYKAMAFCFPPHDVEGYLDFGQYDEHKEGLTYTPLFNDGYNFYINITGITVAGSSLDIKSGQNDMLRCSIDTGTAYTVLPANLFTSLSDAVEKKTRGYYRVGTTNGHTCFKTDPWWEEGSEETPTVEIIFKDGPKITLKEYLLFKEKEGTFCLAFEKSDGHGDEVILGSRHIMEMYTVVDLEKSRMGLVPHKCGN